jgi:hypothetical protein
VVHEDPADPAAVAREIIDGNLYMTIATADAGGLPWATPVYFAPASSRELVWVSSPEARHSRNIAARPDVSIVVFDSQVPLNAGQAVYLSASAGLVPAAELDRCVDAFSRSSLARGGAPWSPDDVGPTSRLRLYRAVATEHWVLDSHDRRIPAHLDPAAG